MSAKAVDLGPFQIVQKVLISKGKGPMNKTAAVTKRLKRQAAHIDKKAAGKKATTKRLERQYAAPESVVVDATSTSDSSSPGKWYIVIGHTYGRFYNR